jgi:hypothetical protein
LCEIQIGNPLGLGLNKEEEVFGAATTTGTARFIVLSHPSNPAPQVVKEEERE